jgi:hypothetical protein
MNTGNSHHYGIFLGFRECLTFGSYRGSIQKPDTRWLAVPRAGIYWNHRYLNAKLFYEYKKLDLYQVSNGRFNFSFYFNIDRRKNTYTPKYIDWL